MKDLRFLKQKLLGYVELSDFRGGDLSMRCAIDQCCLSLRSAVELKKRCFQDRCFCLFPREARC